MTTKIKYQELAKHNKSDDVWIVINGVVYDPTPYLTEHPGGPVVLISRAGQIATVAFEQAHHSKNAIQKILPKYRIGVIDEDSQKQAWQIQNAKGLNTIFVVMFILLIMLGLYYLTPAE